MTRAKSRTISFSPYFNPHPYVRDDKADKIEEIKHDDFNPHPYVRDDWSAVIVKCDNNDFNPHPYVRDDLTQTALADALQISIHIPT